MESDSVTVIEEIESIRDGLESDGRLKVSRVKLSPSPDSRSLDYTLFFDCRGREGSFGCSHEFTDTIGLISSAKEVKNYLSENGLAVEVLSA